MKCFNHTSTDAIGVCRSCGRGLCQECNVEVGLSCCCLNRCEQDVRTLIYLTDKGRAAYASYDDMHKQCYLAASFYWAIGLIMLGFGLWQLRRGVRASEVLLCLMGLSFVGMGFVMAAGSKRTTGGDPPPDT